MRLFRILPALVFVAAGAALGLLNPQPVVLDLGVTALRAGLGVLVLGALLAGAVAGGLVLALGVILPLRNRLRRASQRDEPEPLHPPQDMGV